MREGKRDYRLFSEYLSGLQEKEVRLTFSEIEGILGADLPRSAHNYDAWWANDHTKAHIWAYLWGRAGWSRVELSRTEQWVVFRRVDPEDKESVQRELAEQVAAASQLSDAALTRRLKSAPKLPERVQLVSTGFRRNPHVIVFVLRRANGVCEKCEQAAPFTRRSDGTPFLEVHHLIPLGEGGEDTIENAAALCPNCHRKAHHG